MSTETPEQPPRIPGVRYRKVTRYRQVTTEINGQPETQDVPYDAYVPVPRRDLDTLIVRAVTCVAVGVTLLSVSGTMASVGGLLSKIVPQAVGYGLALVFDLTWLACLGVEVLERFDPERARDARVAGWVALLVSMGSVYAYGDSLHQPIAGGAVAAVGLLAKGLWTLVLRYYSVELSDGVAFWMRRRREKLAATAAVSAQLRRMDGQERYLQAVYGPAATTAAQVTTTSEAPQLQAGPDMSAPVSGQAAAVSARPVPPMPAAPPAPSPAPPAEAPAADPAPAQAGAPAAPVLPASEELQAPIPPVAAITRLPIAEICRRGIAADRTVTNAALVEAALRAGHPNTSKLPETIRRSAQREDPNRRKTS